MKITIYVPEVVNVPDRKLPAIKKEWREHWGLPASADDITDEDILITAVNLGIVSLPANYILT